LKFVVARGNGSPAPMPSLQYLTNDNQSTIHSFTAASSVLYDTLEAYCTRKDSHENVDLQMIVLSLFLLIAGFYCRAISDMQESTVNAQNNRKCWHAGWRSITIEEVKL